MKYRICNSCGHDCITKEGLTICPNCSTVEDYTEIGEQEYEQMS